MMMGVACLVGTARFYVQAALQEGQRWADKEGAVHVSVGSNCWCLAASPPQRPIHPNTAEDLDPHPVSANALCGRHGSLLDEGERQTPTTRSSPKKVPRCKRRGHIDRCAQFHQLARLAVVIRNNNIARIQAARHQSSIHQTSAPRPFWLRQALAMASSPP